MKYLTKFFQFARHTLIPGAILGAAYILKGVTLPTIMWIKTDALLSWLLIGSIFMVALPFYFIAGFMCIDMVMARLRRPANPLQAMIDRGDLQVMHLGGDESPTPGGNMTGGTML